MYTTDEGTVPATAHFVIHHYVHLVLIKKTGPAEDVYLYPHISGYGRVNPPSGLTHYYKYINGYSGICVQLWSLFPL